VASWTRLESADWELLDEPALQGFEVEGLTLPDGDDSVAVRFEEGSRARIALTIGSKLLPPELSVAFWESVTRAPFMGVPVAAVDE